MAVGTVGDGVRGETGPGCFPDASSALSLEDLPDILLALVSLGSTAKAFFKNPL